LRYASAYRKPDHDDKGHRDISSYIVINSVGYYNFDETYGATHRKEGRKDFYISYNHDGAVNVRISGVEHQIGAGDVFIYHPGQEQYYGQANNEPISNYWMHFTGYGAFELLAHAKLAEQNIFHVGVQDELTLLFNQIIDEVTNKNPAYELLSASLMIKLVSLISRKLIIGQEIPTDRRYSAILDSIQYIHRNYEKKLSVTELAKISHLSVTRFSNVFKQSMGVSPQHYIVRLRLEKACELMRHTKLNFRQISTLVGFHDQLYFSRLFKKHMGASPTAYLSKME
jgi:AraC family transcriptional regulator of arabinose operon